MTQKEKEQAIRFEQMLLGAIINAPNMFKQIKGVLFARSFIAPEHRIIYGAMEKISNDFREPNYINILDNLTESGDLETFVSRQYITSLLDVYIVDKTINDLIGIIHKNWKEREFGEVIEEVRERYQDTKDIENLILETKKRFDNIHLDFREDETTNVRQSAKGVLERMYYLKNNPDKIQYVNTTFKSVDRVLGGLEPSSFNIISARTGYGKTSFAMNVAVRLAKEFKEKNRDASILYITLEMPQSQITKRILSMMSRIELWKFRGEPKLDTTEWKMLQNTYEELKGLENHLLINDNVSLNAHKLKSLIDRYKREKNLKVVFIDYLQLIVGDNNKPEYQPQMLATLTRQLKKIAMEEDVIIIALSQVNRKVDERQGNQIYLSDLSGSSGLENNADSVLFLNRPQYYHDEKNICEVEMFVAKNRHGETGKVLMAFDKERNLFGETRQKVD